MLVLGAGGGVGLAAVQIAKLMGARVIATASTDDKLARVGEYGADHLVNYATDDRWDATVRALTGKRGADVIIETVGAATWERSIRALGKGGRLVTSGATSGPIGADGHPLSLPARAAPHGQQRLDARRAAARRRARLRGQARGPWSTACCRSPRRRTGETALERRQVFGKVIIRPRECESATMLPDNVGHLFDVPLALIPDRVAIIQGDRELTFAELDARCNRMANALRELGVGPGDRVALMFSNDFRFLESLFGPMRLGAVAVPLNTRMGDDALQYVVDDAEAVVMIANRRHGRARPRPRRPRAAPQAPDRRRSPPPTARSSTSRCWPRPRPRSSAGRPMPDEICMQPYTSGSTGKPKGVLLAHGGQIWNADVLRKASWSTTRSARSSPCRSFTRTPWPAW